MPAGVESAAVFLKGASEAGLAVPCLEFLVCAAVHCSKGVTLQLSLMLKHVFGGKFFIMMKKY